MFIYLLERSSNLLYSKLLDRSSNYSIERNVVSRITLREVAKHVGVSRQTVSNVLNDNPGMKAVTRAKVMDAIATLGYTPDLSARNLRTRRTATVASIIPDLTNPFYPAFERGIQDVLENAGYNLIIFNTDGILERERKSLQWMLERRVDGAIVVFFHLSSKELKKLDAASIAVVRLEAKRPQRNTSSFDNLFVDNEAAAFETTQYLLLEKGHKRIAFIGSQFGPGRERELGYRRALQEREIEINKSLVVQADFTVSGGERAMAQLLTLAQRPTAVFAANDLMAFGAMSRARTQGLRIPDDVAVVGFDDLPAAQLVTPTLTTVTQFNEEMGKRAAELLLNRLNGSSP